MRTALLAFCLLLLTGCDTNGPAITGPRLPSPGPFEVVFGTEHYDAGLALLLTSAGDLLVAGAANGVVAPADGTLPTPGLSRLDETGAVAWTRIYDALRYGAARAVLEAAPDRFVLLIERHDESFRNRGLALWQVDADGGLLRPLYERPNGTAAYLASRPLIPTRDGGFLLVGNDRVDQGPDPAFVLRLDARGAVQWEHRLQENAELSAALELPGGDFAVLGTRPDNTSGYDEQLVLLRLDAGGGVRWRRTLGDANRVERGTALAASGDGGLLIAGNRNATSNDAPDLVPFALQVDGDGNPLWERSYRPTADGRFSATQAVAPTPDGGFALAGWTSDRDNTTVAFVLALTADGGLRWSRTFGAAGEIFQGHDVLALSDGRLVLTGARGPDIPTYGGADFDVFVLTLDADGNRTAP